MKRKQLPLNHEQERIRKWLGEVRFRKTLFAGVEEADVWKKIEELNAMYEAALSAERARYDALLAEQVPIAAKQMVNQMRRKSRADSRQEKTHHAENESN